jgi:hypothetical protein
MYDSTDVEAIPLDATWVLAYVDEPGATFDAARKRFPKARIVTITRDPAVTADELDVENGAATDPEAAVWVRQMRARGRRPIVYCSQARIAGVDAACIAIAERAPFIHGADWTGVPHLNPGEVATQYASPTVPDLNNRGYFDLSLVSLEFPNAFQHQPKGPTKVIPVPTTEQLSALLHRGTAITAETIAIGNQLHLPPGVRAVIAAAGALLIALERYMGSTKTGTPAPKA